MIDYEKLKTELKGIFDLEIYQRVAEDPELKENDFPEQLSSMSISFDAKTVISQLAYYFEISSKNFRYSTAADKKFQNLLKALIKNIDELKKFIRAVGIDFKEFIRVLSFSIPSVFTPNLIKFIKENYLNKMPMSKEGSVKQRKTKKDKPKA